MKDGVKVGRKLEEFTRTLSFNKDTLTVKQTKVQARRLTFPGWEQLEFFVYLDPMSGWWKVCEVSTGCCIVQCAFTRKYAIQDALDRLEQKGLARVEADLAERLAELATAKYVKEVEAEKTETREAEGPDDE